MPQERRQDEPEAVHDGEGRALLGLRVPDRRGLRPYGPHRVPRAREDCLVQRVGPENRHQCLKQLCNHRDLLVFTISDLKDTKSSFRGANFLLYIPQTSPKFTGKLLDFLALESLIDTRA